MTYNALIRPAWTPATIALMIVGFMIFWPLGLAMLAYILFGDRLDTFKRDINDATDSVARAFRSKTETTFAHSTGNVAFDEWRETELHRLEEERRKLEEMRAEFDAHMRELRRARDREEFESFMAARNSKRKDDGGEPTGPSVPVTG